MFKQFKITKMYQLTRILTGYRKCCLKILSKPETGCAQRLSKLSGMLDIIRKFCAQRLSKMSESDGCPSGYAKTMGLMGGGCPK
jgi:hypothetical protein